MGTNRQNPAKSLTIDQEYISVILGNGWTEHQQCLFNDLGLMNCAIIIVGHSSK